MGASRLFAFTPSGRGKSVILVASLDPEMAFKPFGPHVLVQLHGRPKVPLSTPFKQ